MMNSTTKYALFLLICLPSLMLGQSLQVVKLDSLVVGDAHQDYNLLGFADIQNVSSEPIDVLLKRIDEGYNSLTDSNAICWGVCYAPHTTVANTIITLQPGEIDSFHFSAHVYPDRDGIPQEGDISYVMFDANDLTDSILFTITFAVEDRTTSIRQAVWSDQLALYPNPASERVFLEFPDRIGAVDVELYSLQGMLVKQIFQLSNNQTLDLTGLQPGTYLVVFRSQENGIGRKRLLIHP